MSFRFGTIFLTPEGKKELYNYRAHRNRPKRMRDARVYRAIKRLETEDILSQFFADSSDKHDISPNSPENGHLFNAKEIKEFVFHSRTTNDTGRAAYIEELLTKYFQSDVKSFTSAKLMLTSSSASPITMIEGSQIIQKVHSVLRENTECGLHFGIKESLGIDIELRLHLLADQFFFSREAGIPLFTFHRPVFPRVSYIVIVDQVFTFKAEHKILAPVRQIIFFFKIAVSCCHFFKKALPVHGKRFFCSVF